MRLSLLEAVGHEFGPSWNCVVVMTMGCRKTTIDRHRYFRIETVMLARGPRAYQARPCPGLLTKRLNVVEA
jgi:hypothetical protein